MNVAILKDLGRKCGDDVTGAIHRNMLLSDSTAGKLAISSYGAVEALAAFSGVVAAHMGHDDGMTPEFLDEMWSQFLRPLMLANAGAPV